MPLRSENSGGLPLIQSKLGGERPAESIRGGLPLHHGLHILLGLGGPRLPKHRSGRFWTLPRPRRCPP